MANEMRVIGCRICDSRNCEGCNIYTLAIMLYHGELDCLMNEHHCIAIRPESLMQRWISVEDEMPHAEYGESDNVLTINRVGICKVLYFDGGCWCYPTGEPVYFGNPRWRITHWMPLPEPPKED